MTNFIQGYFSSVARTVSYYTPSMDQVAQKVTEAASKGYQLVASAAKAASATLKAVEIMVLPNEACEQFITDSLKSFSLKNALETPLTTEAIGGITDFLKLFFDQIKLPGADKLVDLIGNAMQKPLKIDDNNYAALVHQFIEPVLTPDNMSKAVSGILGTVRHLIHAVTETEKKPGADKKTELLKQLGIHTNFDTFKEIAQKDLRTHIGVLINKLSDLTAEGKSPVVGGLLKMAVLIVGGILCMFSKELSESMYRFALQHYLNFAANKNGDMVCKFLGMEFKIPKAEIDQLHGKFRDYKEVLFWFFIRQTTLQLAYFKDQPSNVDKEWEGLLNELEPILSKTVDSAADHTTPSTWTGVALKTMGSGFLKYMGVGLVTSYLHQLEPSTLIKSTVTGLRKGFFSHLSQ